MKLPAKVVQICVTVTHGLSALAVGAVLPTSAPAQPQEHAQLMVQTGHLDAVDAVAISANGRTVLTGSLDHTARLWEVSTGKELRRFEGHSQRVTSVAFSPDGRAVLTGSWDSAARLWDAATGKELMRFVCRGKYSAGAVYSVAFSSDGQYVLTGCDNAVHLWDAKSGADLKQYVKTPGDSYTFYNSVAFSPDGKSVLAGNAGNIARLWDIETGKELQRFVGHTDSVSSVAFSPDGRSVLTGSADLTARLWEVTTGREIRQFAGHTGGVKTVAFSPDGRSVLTGSLDKTARLWDAASGKELRRLEGHTDAVLAAAFSSDGQAVLIGSSDTTARLWEANTGRELERFQGTSNSVIWAVEFSHDGHSVFTAAQDRTVRLWDLATGEERRRFVGHSDGVLALTLSADGQRLLTGSSDHTARLWDVESGNEIHRYEGHTGSVASVAISPNGELILTASADGPFEEADDETIRLWDATSGKDLWDYSCGSKITSVSLSPDGKTFTTGCYANGISLRNIGDRQEIFHASGPMASIFSPDSQLILCYGPEARLLNAKTGKLLHSFKGEFWSAAFSPDGKMLVTGSNDNTATIWDVESGRELHRLVGHFGWVNAVAFSPDGRLVLTGSYDATARLWDAKTGEQLAARVSFGENGWAVVDPEGRFDTNDLDGNVPLHWIVDDNPMHALPVEVFMRDYYTPGLLARIIKARIIKGDKLPDVRSISEIPNRVQPEVKVLSVAPSKSQPDHVDIRVYAQSMTNDRKQNSGLQDLRVFRNGQLVRYLEGPLKDGDFTMRGIQLPLGQTKATFTAYAFSKERIKSPTASLDYEYQPTAAPKPRAYLVQIGVNHYQATSCELQGAVNDAEKLNALLMERLKARGYEVISKLLTSSTNHAGATKDGVRKALGEIAAVAAPDDAFFLSFSGHGYSNPEGKFYMMPSSIQGSCMKADAALLSGAISADELAEWLRPVDAGEMTFVLDSCYSAESIQANDFKPGPMGSQGLGQLAYDKRIRILAASQADATAAEDRTLHMGLLTYELTEEGLVKGEADWKPKDGRITVGEWLGYAAQEVPRFREQSARTKGFVLDSAQSRRRHDVQVPALFDFAKSDSLILQ
jgi:WD40 repeat protein/uncharacterized caspase-like protein